MGEVIIAAYSAATAVALHVVFVLNTHIGMFLLLQICNYSYNMKLAHTQDANNFVKVAASLFNRPCERINTSKSGKIG